MVSGARSLERPCRMGHSDRSQEPPRAKPHGQPWPAPAPSPASLRQAPQEIGLAPPPGPSPIAGRQAEIPGQAPAGGRAVNGPVPPPQSLALATAQMARSMKAAAARPR